ncbi:MAG: GNAT family N-acetyltransferase [Marinobacter sp.]
MVIAETSRVLLREFSLDDVGALAEILGDPDVMEFSAKGPCTEDNTRQYINWCLDSYRDHGFGQWAIVNRLSRAVIGFCGLSHLVFPGLKGRVCSLAASKKSHECRKPRCPIDYCPAIREAEAARESLLLEVRYC